MSRLETIDCERAPEKTTKLLNEIKEQMGMLPNVVLTIANSPAALEAFWAARTALEGGVLPEKLRRLLAVTVAEANHAHYCTCGRTAMAKASGCTEEEIVDARRGVSTDRRLDAALQFAKELVEKRGWVTDGEFRHLRDVGYDNREITEVIANVGLFIFGDYLTQVAETEVDFPEVVELVGV